MINDKITEHTIHIVPPDFQLHADSIIGIDALNKSGSSTHCRQKIIERAKLDTTL